MILLSTQRAQLIRKVNQIVLQAERQALDNMSPATNINHAQQNVLLWLSTKVKHRKRWHNNNPKRQKPEATKKHFVNLSAQHTMLLLLLLQS